MKFLCKILSILTFFLLGCVGTDIVDDPVVGEEITIAPGPYAVFVGESRELESIYTDQYGIEKDTDLTWNSSNPEIATVADGVVTGNQKGQSEIYASFGEIESNAILVTVISSAEDIATVEIISEKTELDVGEMIDLMAIIRNGNDDIINDVAIEWSSKDENVLTVDQNGLATGVNEGVSSVTATAGMIRSAPFTLNVGGSDTNERTTTLMGANGYHATGTVRLFLNDDDDIILELGENFETDFALGTFIYLSNSTRGSTTRSEGLELSEVKAGGMHQFNVTELSSTASLTSYRYIIVLCKPASITFGYGDFESQ